MSIREKGYYKWEGELKTNPIKWLPICRDGILKVFRKKKSKMLFFFCGSSFFIFLLAIYVSTKPELKMLTKLIQQIQSDSALFKTFYTNGYMIWMLIFLTLFAGAELISSDLKFKSFTLYRSRPLSQWDYIFGKYAILLFYLLLFTLVPGILLVVAKMVFTGSFTFSLYLLFASFVFPVILAFFMASSILVFSSLSSNTKFVNIMFVVFFILSDAIAGIFYGIFKTKKFLLISITQNIQQFGSFVFKQKPRFNAPMWLSAVILVGLTILFLLIINWRLKKAEV